MNKFEDISAFMDGEAGSRHDAVLTAIRSDAELRDAWRRYHLVGDAMRGQLPPRFPASDLSARISTALENEPAIVSPQRRQPRGLPKRLLKPAAGVAIAASVALVAIVGLRGLDQTTTNAVTTTDTVAENDAPAVNPGPDRLEAPVRSLQPAGPSPLARTVSTGSEPAQEDPQQSSERYRFNSYLINHNEYRANSGVRGSMPYARIVAPYGDNQ